MAAALLVASVDAGADEAVPVRVAYEAPQACPDRDALLADIRARTSRLRLAVEGQTVRALRLHVEPEASSFRGALEVVEVDGSTMRRDIHGPTCEAVVSAMAIVAALALDPLGAQVAGDASASLSSPRAASSAAATASADVQPPLPPPPWPAVKPAAPSAPDVPVDLSAPSPPRASRARKSASPAESSRRRLRLGAGLAAEVAGLSAPDVVAAPVGFVEVGLDAAGVLAPSLRAGFIRAEGSSLRVSGDTATFTWLLGRLEPCPVRVRLVASLAVRPCVGVDVGEISAGTAGAPRPTSPERVWADGTLEGRLEWLILGPLSVELEAGLLVPFIRNTFVFEPTTSPKAYEAPVATGVGSVGAMVRFW